MHKNFFVSVSVLYKSRFVLHFWCMMKLMEFRYFYQGTFKSNLLFLSQFTIQETNPRSQFKTNVHTEQKKNQVNVNAALTSKILCNNPTWSISQVILKKQKQISTTLVWLNIRAQRDIPSPYLASQQFHLAMTTKLHKIKSRTVTTALNFSVFNLIIQMNYYCITAAVTVQP